MQIFRPHDANYESRVRFSFGQQGLMKTIHAEMRKVEPGQVQIELPFSEAVSQQHGYLHAGVVATVIDAACGYAALSLMPAENEVIAVEYKVNFLSPGKGSNLKAIGRVMKSGRTLTICSGEAWMQDKDEEKLVAVMQATMMSVPIK